MEPTRCPSTDVWVKKTWCKYTVESYSALKKNEIMAFAGRWMELENIMLSEISQIPKNQNLNVFSDKQMLIHSVGWVGKNEETLDWAEGSEGRGRVVGMGRIQNVSDILILYTCMITLQV